MTKPGIDTAVFEVHRVVRAAASSAANSNGCPTDDVLKAGGLPMQGYNVCKIFGKTSWTHTTFDKAILAQLILKSILG